MSAGGRVAAFGALLVAIFALAAAAGGAFGPAAADDAGTAHARRPTPAPRRTATATAPRHPPPSAAGLRLVAGGTTFTPGRPARAELPRRRPARRHAARLRHRAGAPHAPHRRAPRPAPLPAPAPRAGRRRQLVDAARRCPTPASTTPSRTSRRAARATRSAPTSSPPAASRRSPCPEPSPTATTDGYAVTLTRAARRRAALRGHPRRRARRRPAALPRRPRPPRHAARRRPRLRARPPARRRRARLRDRRRAARPATGCSSSSATAAPSTRPPSRTRWRG